MTPVIAIFGEMLWDMLPTGKQPGGAPMNVAIHLQNLGANPYFISRLGDDDLGTELLDYIHTQNLAADYIQTGTTHLTGIVKVNLTDKTEVTYKIVQPVAWDYIQPTPENQQLASRADVFVYGSLAARSTQSRDTLFELLKLARLKVFDVNIRPPHFDRSTCEQLMQQADIIKMNEHEISIVSQWYGILPDLETQMKFIFEKFKLSLICVTLGADGAIALDTEGFHRQHGYAVEVQDTIGSGDSFLAMFLREYLSGTSVATSLRKACAIGALVAAHQGATPVISEASLDDFLIKYS